MSPGPRRYSKRGRCNSKGSIVTMSSTTAGEKLAGIARAFPAFRAALLQPAKSAIAANKAVQTSRWQTEKFIIERKRSTPAGDGRDFATCPDFEGRIRKSQLRGIEEFLRASPRTFADINDIVRLEDEVTRAPV